MGASSSHRPEDLPRRRLNAITSLDQYTFSNTNTEAGNSKCMVALLSLNWVFAIGTGYGKEQATRPKGPEGLQDSHPE